MPAEALLLLPHPPRRLLTELLPLLPQEEQSLVLKLEAELAEARSQLTQVGRPPSARAWLPRTAPAAACRAARGLERCHAAAGRSAPGLPAC
jgi:hypothetical protein